MFRKTNFQLFIVSLLILFLELLLIRLVNTEIRIFAYLSNVILITIFVGTGLGLLIKKKIPIYFSALGLFGLELVLVTQYIVRLPNLEFKLFSGITELLAPLSESYIWLQISTYSKSGIIIGLFLTIGLLALVGFIFIALGNYLGRIFNNTKAPILLYSINIVASLLGMWSFNILSIAGITPFLGLLLCNLLIIFLVQDDFSRNISFVVLIAALVLLVPKEAHQPYQQPVTFWSPYQKLTLSFLVPKKNYQAQGWYLEVNNVGYMGLLDLSDKALDEKAQKIAENFKDLNSLNLANQYTLPYKIKPQTKDALIIGGGAGNDAAAALRSGVQNIDLVEIDPTVVSIGKKYHPEMPYLDPRVHVYVNDGRAFIEQSHKKYDVIIMSLADSHTTSSSLSNVQLDNYLYTKESLIKTRNLLKDDGVLFLTFEVTRPWIGGRIQSTIETSFGRKPQVVNIRSDGVFGWGGYMFIAPKNKLAQEVTAQNPQISSYLSANSKDFTGDYTNILTDNWPYIYLDKQRLPLLHLIVALIALLGILFLKSKFVKNAKFNIPFFFLGAGFMLFEVQNITKSALIFGNTWTTNLFIITGVLIFILAANFTVAKKIVSIRIAFYSLFLILILQLLIPINIFNTLPFLLKLMSAVMFLTLPHFFSGIIFASLFKAEKERSDLFGSNLIGSAVGGFVSIISYLFGIESLLLATIGFYVCGYLFANKKYKF